MACWDDSGNVNVGDGWEEQAFAQAIKAYGAVDTAYRDQRTREIPKTASE